LIERAWRFAGAGLALKGVIVVPHYALERNDAMLEAPPAGLIAFPGSGISANLADKAKMLGIPVWRLGKCGA
jgi:hypothetical protein